MSVKMVDSKDFAIGGGKARQSNIEALRLLSMLMVLNLHSFWGYDHGNGFIQALDFFRESTSICAVNVFLLISGYFGIKWRWKSFYNLVFQIFFYGFGVYVVACSIGIIDFSIKRLLANVTCTYSHWSFIKHYILLYFFSPLLNAFVEKVSNKQLLLFIVVLMICENFISRDNRFTNYCLMYLVGRWLYKTDYVTKMSINPAKFYWIITFAITFFVYFFYTYTPINTAERMCNFVLGYDYAAPLVIIQAICIFILFARLQFRSKIINWCASSSLAIFLIHMHPSISGIGYYAITESFYNMPVWQHCIYLILLITGVLFGSILIDKIRIVISDFVYLIIEKFVSLLPTKILSVDTYIPQTLKRIL